MDSGRVSTYFPAHCPHVLRRGVYIKPASTRHRGKRRIKYGSGRKRRIAGRVSIDHRPSVVDDKVRLGDFEIDTIIGKGRQGAIVTIVERKSMYLKLSIPCRKTAKLVTSEIIRLLGPHKKKVHTITTDNGLEFAKHQSIAQKLKCDYYFCHPYSSWERGLNENINGIIGKWIDFYNRQRKHSALKYKTPVEVFQLAA